MRSWFHFLRLNYGGTYIINWGALDSKQLGFPN